MEIRYTNKMEGQLTEYQRSLEDIILSFPYSYVDKITVSHSHNYGSDCEYVLWVAHWNIILVVNDSKGYMGYSLFPDNKRMGIHQDNADGTGLLYLKTLGELADLVTNLQQQHLIMKEGTE